MTPTAVSRRQRLSRLRFRPGVIDLILTILVVTWAMNIVVSRWVLTHGVAPLAYAGLRYLLGGVALTVYTRVTEGPFDLARLLRSRLLVFATLLFLVNQITFVYALKLTNASISGLVFGAAPIATAGIAFAVGTERVTRRFLLAATASLGGVGLVALSAGSGGSSTGVVGILVALALMLTWSLYTVVAARLMNTWSPFRIMSVIFFASGVGLVAAGGPQLAAQRWGIHWYIWAICLYAVASLLTANLLYLVAMRRVGPSQTALYANFQPFVAVVLAVLILSESLTWLEVLGGVAIAAGIAISWNYRKSIRAIDAVE